MIQMFLYSDGFGNFLIHVSDGNMGHGLGTIPGIGPRENAIWVAGQLRVPSGSPGL